MKFLKNKLPYKYKINETVYIINDKTVIKCKVLAINLKRLNEPNYTVCNTDNHCEGFKGLESEIFTNKESLINYLYNKMKFKIGKKDNL